ncbi:APC family permease [Mucilaginibacter sp. BT774]|uniref:APC family permease n=1 Tax=Mucilaginibacter sp. BT774 TaxID=3062276 RepID=UPI00267602F7|nr:amino acid permease [Mucilaginibacter sp. BT774]MDO3625263.1 amino acid permease [Mucilaginibacter sp. BT774]
MAQLERKLGLWVSISIVIGSVIGSSIFMKPATMAAQLSSPSLLLLVWIVAGIVSLFGAMINAEVGCILPETGGQYVYFKHMYGDFFAYLYGWACFIVINTASISGIAFVFADYTGYFVKLPHFSAAIEHSIPIVIPFIGKFYLLENIGTKAVAIFLIVLFTLINIRSLKASGGVQVFLSVLKVVALLFLIGAIFFSSKGNAHNLVQTSASFNYSGWKVLTAFIAATTGALAAYDGWNNLGFISGEIRNPQRNIPRGLIMGLGVCVLIYALTNEAYLYMLPVDTMQNSALVASDALYKVLGVAGGGFVAVLVIISTAGSTNGNILPCARIIYAMAEEKHFFPSTGKASPKYHTPVNALWVQAIWAVLLVFMGSFDMLMDMFVFISWVYYGFAAYGIVILRKKMPNAERPYKLKGYPYLPAIFILFTTLYVVVTLYNDINNYLEGKSAIINSVFGIALTAIGIPLYWYFKKNEATKDVILQD